MSSPTATGTTVAPDPRRWLALAVIAISQLMIVLDATIVNIALPQAQEALAINDVDRQWIVTAYTLAFGGLLLLGGRIADYTGRKRTFIIGLVGFAIASALGGLATEAWVLFAARALQGAFAALMAPAALSLIAVTFTEPKERARAFGVFGAIAGGGAAIGLLLGGVLTEFASWRWTLLVNTPVAIIAIVGALLVVRESRAQGKTRYDVPGIVLASAGLMSLVYGFTLAAQPERGWDDPLTIVLLALSVVLLVAFVLVEQRTREPLLPLHIVLDRNRGGAYLTFLFVGTGLFAMFLFLTFYLQIVLGYSPLAAGFAFLPFSVCIIAMAGVAAQLLPRVGPRPLMLVGLAMAATGMLLLTRVGVEGNYWGEVFPAIMIMGLGMALVFIPASSTALFGVADRDTGVASATLNTAQQIGGSIGTALLTTVYTQAVSRYFAGQNLQGEPDLVTRNEAFISGYHTAFVWGAGFLIAAFVATALLIKVRKSDLPAAERDAQLAAA